MKKPFHRVFVVEDEALLAMELETRLRDLGYTVCGSAKRGEGLTSLVLDAAPDVLLMDISLAGDVDGITAARALQEQMDIPIVFLTAYSDGPMLHRAMAVSPYGYLVKPFEERELHATLQAALERHAYRIVVEREKTRLWERSIAPIIRKTLDGAYLAANPAAVRWHGYESEIEFFEAEAEKQRNPFVDPNVRARILEEIHSVGFVENFECEAYRHRTGERRWVSLKVWAVYDKGGEIAFLEGQQEDITERKKIEQALEDLNNSLEEKARRSTEKMIKSEAWFRDMAELASDWFWEMDADLRFTYFSERFDEVMAPMKSSDFIGLRRDEIRGSSFDSGDLDAHKGVLESRLPFRDFAYRVDIGPSLTRYISSSGKPMFSSDGIFEGYRGTGRDITERMISREKLELSEARLKRAAEIARVGHYVWDMVTDQNVYASEELGRIHGMPVDEYLKRSEDIEKDLLLIHPDDREGYRKAYADARLRNAPISMEYRVLRPGGEIRHVREAGKLVRPKGGEIRLVEGVVVDITEQKKIENELRQTRDILEAGIEALPVGFAAFSPSGRLQIFNRKYREYLSRSAHLIKAGLHIEDLIRYSAGTVAETLGYKDSEKYVNERLASIGDSNAIWTYKKRDGRWVSMTEFETARGGFISIIEDITEEREKNDELQQARKMEALGQLTAGVAHDFNNLLAVIQGNLEMIGESECWENICDYRSDALTATERAGHLTEQLLVFGRQANIRAELIDVADILRSAERNLKRVVPETIILELRVDAEDLWVWTDPGLFENAIQNLAINARDAMPGGGRITLEARHADIERSKVFQDSGTPHDGPCVEIVVRDTGCGIEEEIQKSVFQPFFTTKPVGHGSGLGLAMVYGFLKQTGGDIQLFSEPGLGSSFHLFLPAETKGSDRDRRREDTEVKGGCENLLLVEDNDDVRRVIRRQLEGFGYKVTEAADGRSALDQVNSRYDIDLVLTDLSMPGDLQGADLAQFIRERDSQLPILFMSGFPETSVGRQGGLRPEDVCLLKPVRSRDLALAVRCLLDREEDANSNGFG